MRKVQKLLQLQVNTIFNIPFVNMFLKYYIKLYLFIVAEVRFKRALIDFPEEFLVNRPFLFIIYHKPSKIPIFLGSVKDINVSVKKDEL